MLKCARCHALVEDLLDCSCGEHPPEAPVCESCFEEHECPEYPPRAVRREIAAIRAHPDPEVARCFAYSQGLRALEVAVDALEQYGGDRIPDEALDEMLRLLRGASPPEEKT